MEGGSLSRGYQVLSVITQEEHFATREIVADAAGRGDELGGCPGGQWRGARGGRGDSQELESSELLLRGCPGTTGLAAVIAERRLLVSIFSEGSRRAPLGESSRRTLRTAAPAPRRRFAMSLAASARHDACVPADGHAPRVLSGRRRSVRNLSRSNISSHSPSERRGFPAPANHRRRQAARDSLKPR